MRIGTAQIIAPTPAAVVEAAADAARRGLDSFWTNQMPGGWDPLMLLGLLRERPAEIGTGIVPTFPRHPVTMAAEALTLNAAGGGLVLGVGTSHAWYVEQQLGIPYTSPLRHTREYLDALRPLLRGEHVRRSGEFVTVDTALETAAGKPPSVLLAALGPKMLALAGELADGVVATWVTPEMVAERLVPSQPEGARIVASLLTVLTTDPDAARERLARDFAMAGESPAYKASLGRAGIGIADTVVAGDEETIARALDRFRDAGVTDLILMPFGGPEDRARTLNIVTA
ncbi:LLM class flavin-dependent oxidoreductase [Catenuloplanes sp. NPDC051500]|uniref:LLM class flavin-dependent oxidoreductase n=1 Tax=Catenuloplanes sp. NPDC051500 TaxID=3363959 RepID=UPI0037B7FF0C